MSLLQVKDLSFSQSGRRILEQVSFELPAGRIVGLVGPNGSGKSSLLKNVSGIFQPDVGRVLMESHDLLEMSSRERACLITYVGSPFDSDFPLTALEGVSLGDYPHTFSIEPPRSIQTPEAVMRETGCWDYRDRLIQSLSSGERQRVSLARALYQRTKIIFLDESLSQLDLHHQTRMGEVLKKRAQTGTAFVLVSHDLNFTTQWSDQLIFLSHGKIIAQDATNEMLHEKNLKALYPDADFDFLERPGGGNRLVYFRT